MTIGEIIDRYRGGEAASRPAPDRTRSRMAAGDEEFEREFEQILEQNERFVEAFDRSGLTAAPLTGPRNSDVHGRPD